MQHTSTFMIVTLYLSAINLYAAPSGGEVISGVGSVSNSNTTTTINQSSQNLSLTWANFNIAPNETVNFIQPSSSAIAINRIYSTDGTQILGHLNFLLPETIPVGYTFWYTAWYAFLYYFFSALLVPFFRHYEHHRSLSPWEVTYWIRSIWRKQWYKIKEKGIENNLTTVYSKKYYLSPLQISTDAQVTKHSDFSSVEHFIERVISSFSSHAPKDTLLVIKHHPLDRGYHDYTALIQRFAHHHNVVSRVYYIHDQHLPTLLEHARGAVMINSTVGLSAIHHNTALKVCGTAIYDLEGLTYQNSLEQFWSEAQNFKSDRNLYNCFKIYVINQKQINGNFYKRLKKSQLKSGLIW